jgi:glucokinase
VESRKRVGLCAQALDLWVELYAAEAGNLALKLKATGGVYLAGGIAPQVRVRLQSAAFVGAFSDKGRMRGLLESIPVHLILEDRVALLSAARCAAALVP